MELVFFYVNQSSSHFIEKQGFNFSPNYSFKVDYQDGKYILKQEHSKERLPQGFFDSSNSITNITAIVGENGSGKTTLLNVLSKYYGEVRVQLHIEKYKKYFSNSIKESDQFKQVVIFRDADILECYYNIDKFENATDIPCTYRNPLDIMNISRISLTNSIYALGNGITTKDSIKEIYLNGNSLEYIHHIFYEHKCKNKKSCAGAYCQFQDNLCENIDIIHFQQILDILYLQYIRSNKIDSIFANNINGDLFVRFQSFKKCLDDIYHMIESERNKDTNLRSYYDVTNKRLYKFDRNLLEEDVFCDLYINLLFEITVYCCSKDYNEESICNKENLINYIKSLIETLSDDVGHYKKYFQDALDEIREYEECIQDCEINQYLTTLSDLEYKSHKKVECGSCVYDKFMNLIVKSAFEREYSFVLKYIDIEGLRLASGERALLNFFSWMHFSSVINKVCNDVEYNLSDNILLLIDEIDLYCHPSWQQKIIKYLIEEVKVLFSGKKVQIIFTTHSPIVLSDMPKSNVIYLKRDEGKLVIDESDKHSETFGANIYKLFDDAFFLGKQGQIGEFSKSKINAIIEKVQPKEEEYGDVIYPKLDDRDIEQLEKEISLIGERIIRDKLYEMLFKCKYRDFNAREKTIKIYEDKIRKLRNEEEI